MNTTKKQNRSQTAQPRENSAETLRELDDQLRHNIHFYSTQPDHIIAQRIEELKNEWSIERVLQAGAAGVGLFTSLFALTGRKKWAVLSCGALAFFLYHNLCGFNAPIPLLRRLGARTRAEIDREIFALKAVRGDFKGLVHDRQQQDLVQPQQILDAVRT